MNTEANKPAFPISCPSEYDPDFEGLTKREWLAGIALSGTLADSQMSGTAEFYARRAVNMADALLAELAKPTETKAE